MLSENERKHLLREGHVLGFVMGLILSNWFWLALIWLFIIAALWLRSLFRESEEEMEKAVDTWLDFEDLGEQKKYRRLEINPDVFVEYTGASPVQAVLDQLMEKGFRTDQPIEWYDDVIRNRRIFTQEIVECTCRESPMGRWVVGTDCPLHGVGR